MPLYAYRATDADGKEIRGSVDAPTEVAAKEAILQDLDLNIMELREASRSHTSDPPPPSPPPLLKTSFVFEGTDDAGNIRKGTIQAETKYEAFDKLRQEHHLHLTLLSPMGIKAPAWDPDLEQWQPKGEKTAQAIPPVSEPMAQASKIPVPASPVPPETVPTPMTTAKKTVGFTILPNADQSSISAHSLSPSPSQSPLSPPLKKYFSLLSTLRLYAGWLLAWYGLFVALGYYSTVRVVPFDIPFVMSFYSSPLIYSVTVAVFLFLLCTAIHKAISGRTASGLMLTIGGIAAFVALKVSV